MKISLEIIKEDKSLITYRPKLNQITKSVTATILLQQILYWHGINNNKPFYKFKAPCKHLLYRKGDSWLENLGFSSAEFDTALQKIACKTTKEKQDQGDKFAYYWTTRDRITYYNINESNLAKSINCIYQNRESAFTKIENPDLDINTKITSKITSKKNIYILFLEKWNEQKIIVHKKITSQKTAAIKKALKDFSQEEIFKSFQNYATVLYSPDYFWNYTWTLEDFLQRGLHRFVDEAKPLINLKNNFPGDSKNQAPSLLSELSPSGFPLIVHSYDRKSKKKKTVEEWQGLFENYTNSLLNANIWKANHTPNKVTVFNGVVSMQKWLDNVAYDCIGSAAGGSLEYKIYPLNKLIDYYIFYIDDWFSWMNGVKDNVFDVNSKIFKMFIRELEESFAVHIDIKSKGWENDSNWTPRN